MPDITIRRLVGAEIVSDYAPLHQYSLSGSATPPINLTRYEKYPDVYEESAVLALFEDNKVVATTFGIPMTQNVRGTIYPMVGIAGVTSDPVTRRKGYMRRLMQATHHYFYERGFPVATLYPFRETFYERMGYTTFTHFRRVKFKTAHLAPLLKMNLAGNVEYMHIRDGWDIYLNFLRERQQSIHGMGFFEPEYFKMLYDFAENWLAVARDESGTVIGVMPYKITGYFETFLVQSFFTSNSLGRYLLLNWIARHTDQTTEVDMKLAPTERPETWLSDMQVKADPDIWITALGRVLDIQKLNGMNVGDGQLCVEVTDEQCAWNQGIFTLTGADGKLTVSAGGSPECTLTIQGLSALIYGTHDPHDFQFRGWGKPSAATLATMQQMFPLTQPYLFFIF
jgi:predicted acetyltransferase